MMRISIFTLCLAPSLLFAQQISNQELAECKEIDLVQYSTPTTVPLKDRVVIARGLSVPGTLPITDKTLSEKRSPQGTARLVFLEQPDFMKGGPYQTKAIVVGNKARPIELTIEFHELGNNPIHIEWLNEKLLFIRVWWGRTVSTDMVLNVETGEPSYLEEANYSGLILPCDAKLKEFKQRRPN
jgi:hypothetical protein